MRPSAGGDRRVSAPAGQLDANQGIGALDRDQHGATRRCQLQVPGEPGERRTAGDVAGIGVEQNEFVGIALGDRHRARHRVDDDAFRRVPDLHRPAGDLHSLLRGSLWFGGRRQSGRRGRNG
jgi:hypothetical protein